MYEKAKNTTSPMLNGTSGSQRHSFKTEELHTQESLMLTLSQTEDVVVMARSNTGIVYTRLVGCACDTDQMT